MMRQIMALFDEYQSKENAKHVLRAMNENARQGFWNGALPPIGYRTRLAALVAFAVLAAAIVLVNRFAGYFWTKGGIEYPAMWALLCLCFVLRQPGPYSLDRLLAGRRAAGSDR